MKETLKNHITSQEALEALRMAVQPVLDGYFRKRTVLSEYKNLWSREEEISFPPLLDTSSEVALETMKRFMEELGLGTGFVVGENREVDHYRLQAPTLYFSTNKEGVFLTRTGIYEKFYGGREPVAVIWSIENLEPMNRRGIFGVKAGEIARRARRAIGLAQYYQG